MCGSPHRNGVRGSLPAAIFTKLSSENAIRTADADDIEMDFRDIWICYSVDLCTYR